MMPNKTIIFFRAGATSACKMPTTENKQTFSINFSSKAMIIFVPTFEKTWTF